MAANFNEIITNLLNFYDFNHKTVIAVGAGGGQLVEYAHACKQVIAIDHDKEAINRLNERLQLSNLEDKFTIINSDFYQVDLKADVVMFEFCLHELQDPKAAIIHAQTLAPHVIVADHWPDSEWAYIADEKEKVTKSWTALQDFKLKKNTTHTLYQQFGNYDELYQKIKVQGEKSIERINHLKQKQNIRIPMPYGFVLI
ncbi:methyltransferase domain-containing protein [Marinilabiliaceae bacterium JC017]|nr:methyltransferase domain-containing protein [Marinilabiliaceae bacterium JC017]